MKQSQKYIASYWIANFSLLVSLLLSGVIVQVLLILIYITTRFLLSELSKQYNSMYEDLKKIREQLSPSPEVVIYQESCTDLAKAVKDMEYVVQNRRTSDNAIDYN